MTTDMWIYEDVKPDYHERWRLEPGWLVHEDGSRTRLPTMVYSLTLFPSINPAKLEKCGIPNPWETISL